MREYYTFISERITALYNIRSWVEGRGLVWVTPHGRQHLHAADGPGDQWPFIKQRVESALLEDARRGPKV